MTATNDIETSPRLRPWLVALAVFGGITVLASPVWAGSLKAKKTTKQHRKEAAELAIKLKVAKSESQVATIPSLTGNSPGTQATKCYRINPGPPKVMYKIDCDTIVIVHDDE